MSRKTWNYLIVGLMIIIIYQYFGIRRAINALQETNNQVDRGAIGGAALKNPDNKITKDKVNIKE